MLDEGLVGRDRVQGGGGECVDLLREVGFAMGIVGFLNSSLDVFSLMT